VPDAIVLGRYLLAAGVLRFAVEFLRVNVRVAFGLSVAHLVSLAAMAAAVILIVARGRQGRN
jgi:prolipoprotein diacylglyceryltransferase